jgi:hypothetical protein
MILGVMRTDSTSQKIGSKSMKTPDGFYAVYMSSQSGEALAVLTLEKGIIRGAGLDSTCYDGSIKLSDNGFDVALHVAVPARLELIQGGSSGSIGLEFDLTFWLPTNFAECDFITIETPHGLVNARFRRLRGLE